jgi:hypothetical protein
MKSVFLECVTRISAAPALLDRERLRIYNKKASPHTQYDEFARLELVAALV